MRFFRGRNDDPVPGSLEDKNPLRELHDAGEFLYGFWRIRYRVKERSYSGIDILGNRMLARTLDILLLASPFYVIALSVEIDFRNQQQQLLMLGLLALYDWFWLTSNDGKTPGKKVTGLRVVRLDGSRLSGKVALLRSVAFVAGTALFMVGHLWGILDPENRSLHDRVAGTIVVNDRYTRTS